MSNTTGQRTGRQRGFAGVMALAVGVGLFALIGLRVKETMADRTKLTAALAERVASAPKKAGVEIVHGVEKRWRPTIPVTGTLAPSQEAEIGFKTSGKLVAVRVKVGDRVKAGRELAALDMSEQSAQASATSAGVRAAQVSHDMAKDAAQRTRALFEQHAVSDAENLGAQNRLALSLAQLEQARAQAQLAAVGVQNGSLTAPFPGLVTKAPSGVGKIVAPGEALFHLEDTSVLKLDATLSEGDARLVEVGASVRVEGGATGKVTAVLGALDPQTRRVPMQAEIPNDAASPLFAGAFVRATVVSDKEIPVVELPPGALRPGSQDDVVVRVKGKAHLVRVVFTQGEGGGIFVRSGITPADPIVRNPSSEVHEGDDLGE